MKSKETLFYFDIMTIISCEQVYKLIGNVQRTLKRRNS